MQKKILLFFLSLFITVFGGLTAANAASYDGKTLDTGIYWFGKGNVSQKFVKGEKNAYFDANKPTVIYIHGWQKDSTKKLYRETFNPVLNTSSNSIIDKITFFDNYEPVNSADYWIDKGWNIGIFYWNQLADEFEVQDAEAKIWTTNGPQKMRWRKGDNSYESKENNTPKVSATELLVQDYIDAMQGYTGKEIRITGHSLGNQIAIYSTKLISDLVSKGTIKSNLLPNRVALFDPFYSKNEKSYLGGKWIGEVCREYVTDLKSKNVVFEEYKSSNINDMQVGDSNDGMKKLTAFIDIWPMYINWGNQGIRHGASRDLYFYSMGFNPPKEIENGVETGNNAGYASTSTERIREMMNSKKKWVQDGGQYTSTPGDDTFKAESK